VPLEELNLFKTGYTLLDNNIKGIALGKVTIIAGLEGSGKSSLLLSITKQFMNNFNGNKVIFYDTENALSRERFEDIGVDYSKIEFPDIVFSFENVFKNIEENVIEFRKKNDKDPILVVIDSLANLPPEAELKGEVGDSDFGLRAKLASQSFRKYTTFYRDMNVTLLITNQLRYKMNPMPFEDPYISPCGKAPYYAAFLHLILKRKNPPWDDKNYVVKAKVIKNKAGAPNDFEFIMNYKKGYNEELSVLNDLLNKKIAINSRGTYEINKIGFKGREASFIQEYPNLKEKILNLYKEEG